MSDAVLLREYRRRLDAIYASVAYLGDMLNHGEYQEIGAGLDGLSTLADVRGDDRLLNDALTYGPLLRDTPEDRERLIGVIDASLPEAERQADAIIAALR